MLQNHSSHLFKKPPVLNVGYNICEPYFTSGTSSRRARSSGMFDAKTLHKLLFCCRRFHKIFFPLFVSLCTFKLSRALTFDEAKRKYVKNIHYDLNEQINLSTFSN